MAEMPEETTYTDKEIEELLLPNDERICNSVPSENSIPSSDLPDLDLSSARSRDKSVDKSPSDSDSESAERDKKPNVPHMFVEIERAIV